MGPLTHGGSKTNLLGKDPAADLVNLLSNERQVCRLFRGRRGSNGGTDIAPDANAFTKVLQGTNQFQQVARGFAQKLNAVARR